MAMIERANTQDDFWIKLYNVTLAPLWYGIKQWFGVAAITSGILYANTLFNMQHDIFPWYIAIAVAAGVAWTYLSGLAYVAAIEQAHWSTHAMIWSGALTDCLFGLLYVLGQYQVIAEKPASEVAFWLAVAHVIPLILLVIIFTYCKRAYFTEKAAAKQIQQDRVDKYKDAKLDIEIRKEELRLKALELKLAGSGSNTVKNCDACTHVLTQGEWLAMKRYNRCKYCPAPSE